MDTQTEVTLDQLTAPWAPDEPPILDRPGHRPSGVAAEKWQRDGYLILNGFIPDELIDAYTDAWLADNHDRPGGWPYNTPYVHVPALRDIACWGPLHAVMADLIGHPMGVHLNLTGWRSTTRNWHQDGYLNPDHVADHYIAAWVALADIPACSGPFEYVPGSHHRFPPIRQNATLAALPEHERGPMWPRHSERFLTPIFEDELRRTRTIPHQFLAHRGDVLLWHARLLHRGSTPTDPDVERRGLIMHYSSIRHRPDMPPAVQHPSGGWWFPIDEGGHR